MKAEELKQHYIRYYKTYDGKLKAVSLEFRNETEMDSFLQQYTDEVSWESNKKTAVDFAKHLSAVIDSGDDLYSFEEEYDNWL